MLKTHKQNQTLIMTLNRPEVKNAINDNLLSMIANEICKANKDDSIKTIIIYGNEDFFAAGADIKELAQKGLFETINDPRVAYWQKINASKKPLLAAVNGFALGAGLELAMCCDIIIAGTNAKLGQPEINLGIIPGAGGSQRLLKAVGKSLAMQMVLSGKPINAKQALQHNLISEITCNTLTLNRAISIAEEINGKSISAVYLAKQAILNGLESGLTSAIKFERQSFISLSDSKDKQKLITRFLKK